MEFRFQKAARAASRTAVVGAVAALVIMQAGCSSSGQQTTASGGGSVAPKAQSSTQAGVGQGAQGNRGGIPGVSGLIAEVDGSTMQVQSQSDQTAVSFSSKTSIEEIKAASAKDVTTGWCATVVSSTKSASPGTTPSKISATTVSLTKPSGSSCGFGGGFGGSGRQRPSGAPSNFPGGGSRPTARPSNFPSNRSANFGSVASGKITKVLESGFVMDATSRGSSGSTQPVTVTLTKSTTVTAQDAAKASAIKAGECVRANGKTDDTGSVTATNLILSSAVKGQCTEAGGFGGSGGFGGRQGGTGSNG